MSYDIDLTDEYGCVSSLNMTSNVACMWRHAGADLAKFNGKPAGELHPVLCEAVAAMLREPDVYAAMNPPNGWGDSITCRDFLRELAQDCGRHPNAIVSVTR